MLTNIHHFMLGLVLLSPMAFADDEVLFSEVAMESVFEEADDEDGKNEGADEDGDLPVEVATVTNGERIGRVTGTASLAILLKAAGFDPQVAGDRVAISIEHAGLKLPAQLRVEIEKDRLACEINLVVIEDKATIDQSKLLELLASSDAIENTLFAYDSGSKTIQLRSSFSNRDVKAKQLERDLIRLAVLAEQTSGLWSNLKPSGETSTNLTTTEAAKSSATGFSLTGLWSATLSGGESIAIQINEDSSFKLATVKAKKSSLSSGTWTRASERLTLVGSDKFSLSGSIQQTSANRFQLEIQNASGKPQLTIDFSRAK